MAKKFIQKWIPDQEKLGQNKYLKWLGPRLFDYSLWHVNRRSVAVGISCGLFFAFLLPIGQIPAAAFTCIFIRGNVPVAAVSTLVTNPFTFPPIWFIAYQVGIRVLGDGQAALSEERFAAAIAGDGGMSLFGQLGGMGLAVLVGMCIFAVSSAVLGYFFTHWAWQVGVRLRRRRRLTQTPQ
jgi:uncharacterized protein (DUF2062 family)